MKHLSMILFLTANAIAAPAFSNPLNPTVVNGSANFSQSGNVLTVTNSNGAIINWNKFSIAAGESTQFVQPSASSSVLNRVLSDPSTIFGTLSSNGQVFLVNPSGIIVGSGGRIDAGGIVLSTGNISNADFLAGNIHFDPPPAATPIVISGRLDATDRIEISGSLVDCSTCTLNAPNIFIDGGGVVPPPLPVSPIPFPLTPPMLPPFLPGTSTGWVGSSGGSISLFGGPPPMPPGVIPLFLPGTSVGRWVAPMGGSISLGGAPSTAPSPAPSAVRTGNPVRLVNTGSLVDGAVTVRMSLVDASPIMLR